MTGSTPFPLPTQMSAHLTRVKQYWEGLKRAENAIPFWDDVNPSALPELENALMLIEVFERPRRFRFNMAGERIVQSYGAPFAGEFVDGLDAKSPLHYFVAQASVTVEGGQPTYYRHESGQVQDYGRILLPLWGDGRVKMLLGAVAFE